MYNCLLTSVFKEDFLTLFQIESKLLYRNIVKIIMHSFAYT